MEEGGSSIDMDRVYRHVTLVLVPMFALISILNHVDRTNLAFAALTFNNDVGLDPSSYGLGSGLFFLGYIASQVPSNFVVMHVGARRWLAILLVAWGGIASSMMFVTNTAGFYTARFFLGVAEAGAFPAMWHHLILFFPKERLTKPFASLNVGTMLANVVGAPLAAGLLSMNGLAGLRGWQWLFLLEGLPSVLLGVVVWFTLPDSPDALTRLPAAERAALIADVAVAAEHNAERKTLGKWVLLLRVLRNKYMYLMCLSGLMAATASYTYIFWTPIMINALLKGTALTTSAASLSGSKGSIAAVALAAVPYSAAAITTYLVAAHSQRRRELFWHVSIPLVLSGIVFACFPAMARSSQAAGFVCLVLTVALAAAVNGPAINIVASLNPGPHQLVALPVFNSLSVLGGFIGPLVAGAIVQHLPGGFLYVTVVMGVLLLCTGLLVLVLRFWVSRGELAGEVMLRRGGGSGCGGRSHGPRSAASELRDNALLTAPSALTAGAMREMAVKAAAQPEQGHHKASDGGDGGGAVASVPAAVQLVAVVPLPPGVQQRHGNNKDASFV